MGELTVIAKAKSKPGLEKNLEQELRAVVNSTHLEAGCLKYALHRSVDDSTSFVVVERWSSKAALDAHFAQPYVQTLLQRLQSLLIGAPEIQAFELLPEGQPEKTKL